jgi:uncharacterized protein YbaR (Trm112 family)
MLATRADQSNARDFCCVRCGAAALVQKGPRLHCQSCGTDYPIVHDVPILFPDVVIESAKQQKNMAAIVTAVCDYQKLPTSRRERETVKSIFSKNYRFADFLLDVESQQYLDRMRVSQPPTPVESSVIQDGTVEAGRLVARKIKRRLIALKRRLQGQHTLEAPIPASSSAPALQYQWVHDYLPRQMVVNQCFTGNVRLHNIGDRPISSQGETPIQISYHWLTASGEVNDHASDATNAVPEHRTPFPIDVQPGQQITVPMLIETPEQPGQYQLQLCLVEEYVQWHETNSLTLPIEIINAEDNSSAENSALSTWQQTEQIYSYYDDHQRGIALLKSQLAKLPNPQPKILEIGGNACPMLSYDFCGQLYNLDIDVHGLQIGKLTSLHQGLGIEFVCADANHIPFPDDYFDCITIFASLHHFPDLRVTLRSLAKKIQPQGFLAIMCEPVGHYYGDQIDPLFREELLKGVNEQSFSLVEYAAIFQAAGLEPEQVIVDGCSLKAFLKRQTENINYL